MTKILSQGYIRQQRAAEYLGVTERHLYTLRQKRLIPFYHPGRSVLFRIADLDAYMDSFRVRSKGIGAAS